jgi:hypothetical protein
MQSAFPSETHQKQKPGEDANAEKRETRWIRGKGDVMLQMPLHAMASSAFAAQVTTGRSGGAGFGVVPREVCVVTEFSVGRVLVVCSFFDGWGRGV